MLTELGLTGFEYSWTFLLVVRQLDEGNMHANTSLRVAKPLLETLNYHLAALLHGLWLRNHFSYWKVVRLHERRTSGAHFLK